MTRASLPSFPLLGKDLTELAARRRTYALRFANAVILALIFLGVLADMQDRAGYDVLRLLGRGYELFTLLIVVQMAAIYIILPAAVAPAITYEKERNALELLLLTGISPWQILLQKFVARLVPMFTLMLLCLPAMAVAYAYGGFGSSQLAAAAYVLLLTCLQVAAVALMWSCFSRTTSEAFMATYGTLALLYFGPPLLYLIGYEFFGRLPPGGEASLFAFAPPYLMVQALWGPIVRGPGGPIVVSSIGIWLSIAAAMVLSRVWLVSRMHVTPRRYGMRLLKWFDELFRSMNRITGDRVIIADQSQLPADEPVAWRETRSRWIGRPQHLMRVLLLIEIPIVLICVRHVVMHWARSDTFHAIIFMLWIGTSLLIIVQTVNVLGAERTHQTLGVLLTTPLTGREILRQKLAPIRHLLIAMLLPLVTVIAFEWWLKSGDYRSWMRHTSPVHYAFISTLTIAVYLPLCMWAAAMITLKMRSHGRALIASIFTAVGVCFVPLAMAFVLVIGPINADESDPPIQLLLSLSPVIVISLNEFSDISFGVQPGGDLHAGYVLFALASTAGVTLLLRHLCYTHADTLLGRAPQSRRVPTPVIPADPADTARFADEPDPAR